MLPYWKYSSLEVGIDGVIVVVPAAHTTSSVTCGVVIVFIDGFAVVPIIISIVKVNLTVFSVEPMLNLPQLELWFYVYYAVLI